MGRWKSKKVWQKVALLVGGVVIALGLLTAYLLRDPHGERHGGRADAARAGGGAV